MNFHTPGFHKIFLSFQKDHINNEFLAIRLNPSNFQILWSILLKYVKVRVLLLGWQPGHISLLTLFQIPFPRTTGSVSMLIHCAVNCSRPQVILKIQPPFCLHGPQQTAHLRPMLLRYHTHAIITRSLYIFYIIFEDHFFVFKEVFFTKFCPCVWLVFKTGFHQEWVMMVRVW